MLLRLAGFFLLLLLLATAAPAQAAIPEGAEYTQEYVPTQDGKEELHVDVLKPAGLPEGARTPVIAIVSPYLGHAVDGEAAPSSRFNDLLEGAKVFERGYTVVLVDLRGSGGSSGCLDILGPGEQDDVRTAVEWAAEQPWSTGRVGMYGKSYDGNTGVVGAALQPKGLDAVVAQQVVGDRYSGSYAGRVRYLQSFAYPSVSYGSGAEAGFTLADDERYTLNSVANSADCQPGLAGHYGDDPSSEFWRSRDFVAKGAGSTVPFLMTTGFLDANTNIGAKAIDFYEGLRGPKRLWLGWWDHVRGNDLEGDRLAMGRAGWFEEVGRFFDEHLKGIAPSVQDPAVAVQDSDGRWREEAAWPPADGDALTAPLAEGSYADDGKNLGSKDLAAGAGGSAPSGNGPYETGSGAWTLSPPLPHAAHAAGIPEATVDVAPLAPATNLVVNLYDVDPEGNATMITRGARLVDAAGPAELTLYPTEWTFAAGHRIGVLVSGANAEAWIHTPTQTDVAVRGGNVTLPFLREARTSDLPGEPAPRLEEFREAAPFPVPVAALQQPAEAALVPAAQEPASPAEEPEAPGPDSGAGTDSGEGAGSGSNAGPGPGPGPGTSSGPPTANGPTTPSTPSPSSPAPLPSATQPGAKPRTTSRLTARLRVGRRAGSRPAVAGRAPTGAKVRIVLTRRGRVIARRTVTARRGAYRAVFRMRGRRAGLRARVSTGTLRATARATRRT